MVYIILIALQCANHTMVVYDNYSDLPKAQLAFKEVEGNIGGRYNFLPCTVVSVQGAHTRIKEVDIE